MTLGLVGCDQVFGLDGRASGPPILEGFEHRKRIRLLSEESETLENFPFAIGISDDPDLKAADLSGLDFAMTGADGIRLDIEVESFDPAKGDLDLWVRIPSLAGQSETEIFLYYGGESLLVRNPGTWRDEYAAVWHFNGKVNVETEDDSTQHGLQVTDDSTLPASTEGMFGPARSFEGNTDRYRKPPHCRAYLQVPWRGANGDFERLQGRWQSLRRGCMSVLVLEAHELDVVRPRKRQPGGQRQEVRFSRHCLENRSAAGASQVSRCCLENSGVRQVEGSHLPRVRHFVWPGEGQFLHRVHERITRTATANLSRLRVEIGVVLDRQLLRLGVAEGRFTTRVADRTARRATTAR